MEKNLSHDLVLPEWNFNPSSWESFHPTITSVIFLARQDRFPHVIFLQNPIDSHNLKMFTKWWNSIKIFVYFFHADWRHMRRKNTIETTRPIEKHFYGIFQIDGGFKLSHRKISSRQSWISAKSWQYGREFPPDQPGPWCNDRRHANASRRKLKGANLFK